MDQKKNIKRVAFIVVLANLALVMYVLLGSFSSKPMSLPNPNGYDDFVKAGTLLQGEFTNSDQLNRQELAALVSTNSESLKLLETGLSKQCLVLEDYSPTNSGELAMARFAGFKKSARLFTIEGRLAQLEGRTNEAVKFYLAGIAFGQKSAHGGVFIDQLVGIACQSIAERPLEVLLNELNDAKTCAAIARELEKIDANDETDEEVLQHENHYMNAKGGIAGRMNRLIGFQYYRTIRERTLGKLHAWTAHRRQIMLNFAARGYELDKGKRLANAAALVPVYLKKIPQDPVTGKDLLCPP